MKNIWAFYFQSSWVIPKHSSCCMMSRYVYSPTHVRLTTVWWRTALETVTDVIFVDDSDRKYEISRTPVYCARSSVSDKMNKTNNYASASAPTSTSSYQSPTNQTRTIPDMYAPQVFNVDHPDLDSWLAHFKRYDNCCQFTEDQLTFFLLFLKDAVWYGTLLAAQKQSIDELLTVSSVGR